MLSNVQYALTHAHHINSSDMKDLDQSITKRLTNHARQSLLQAQKITHAAHLTTMQTDHLLYGIFLQKGSVGSTILHNMNLKKHHFEKEIFRNDNKQKNKPKTKKNQLTSKALPLNVHVKSAITGAYAASADFGYPYVGTEHLVYALLGKPSSNIRKIIAHCGSQKIKSVKKKKAPKASPKNEISTTNNDNLGASEPKSNSIHAGPNGFSPDMLSQIGHILGSEGIGAHKSQEEEFSGALDQFAIDTADTSDHHAFVGYAKIVDRITTTLGRKNKNNPLLVGEPGVGKTALVEHLAQLAKSDDAPAHLRGKKILTLDLALLVAGTSFRGEFEQRLKDVIAEASASRNTILFIDEIHTIIGTGNAGGSLDVANILKPSLARGALQIIGATTHTEYKKHIAADPALSRRFQKVLLTEPTPQEAYKILHGARKSYEKYHGVQFSPESLRAAVDLSIRYIPEQYLPDKAFDLLDETAARLHGDHQDKDLYTSLSATNNLLHDLAEQKTNLLRAQQYDAASIIQKQEIQAQKKSDKIQKNIAKHESIAKYRVTKEDIVNTLSHTTGIPNDVLLSDPSKRITQAVSKLKKTIVGQDVALEIIGDTLTRAALGLSNTQRPQGSFLFLGPTGVGKTLTAKTLAHEIFGSDDALIRIDMSELMERHSTARLLGAPAGYVGYGEGGTLTEKIKKKPYSVVLFDEIEKAHPDTFNILLQILEDGTITDGEGTTANFRNAIIILTSNIGATNATGDHLGFNANDANTKKKDVIYEKAAADFLAPELISRLDHVVTFAPLNVKDLQKITRAEVRRIAKNLKARNITLTCNNTAIAQITNMAIENDAPGEAHARRIRKYIQDTVEKDLANHLLQNKVSEIKSITLSFKKTSKQTKESTSGIHISSKKS